MELWRFRFEWREICVEVFKNKRTDLVDLVLRCNGEQNIGGVTALRFEPINSDEELVFLRPAIIKNCGIHSEKECLHCHEWNEESNSWEDLGKIFYTAKWGINQLKQNWRACKIEIFGFDRIVNLKEILSDCRGEKGGGLLFLGRGIFADETLILKLDEEEEVKDYYGDQKCYRFNKKTDEWEFFGRLIKEKPPPPYT